MTDLKRIYQSDLPSRAIAVYLYLRGRANREGVCWPAIPTMARELKMSESTVRRGVRDLEKAGFLSVEERFRWNKAGFVKLVCARGAIIRKTASQQVKSKPSRNEPGGPFHWECGRIASHFKRGRDYRKRKIRVHPGIQ